MDDRTAHALGILMRAKTSAADAAERRVEFAYLELPERSDRRRIRDVERQDAGMRAPASCLLFIGALRLVFLVDRHGNAASVDALRYRHDGVGRLRKKRVIIVRPKALRLGNVG